MGGPEASECEDEALYGREYLDWKKQTLGTQKSDHKTNCDFSAVNENDSDEEEDKQDDWDEEEPEYKLEMAHGYVKKGEKPKGACLGLIVEGGYMFLLDPDMSHFPLLTWHCPKYKAHGCPASFVTRITNPEQVRDGLDGCSHRTVATSLEASHVMENLDSIENHANHRPGHYKENISPLIHGLFSREVRVAFLQYLRKILTPVFPSLARPPEIESPATQEPSLEMSQDPSGGHP